MATSRALAVDNEVVQNTELVVTSALAGWVSVTLPPIGDGTGATVADNFGVTFWANSTGGLYVKDQAGRLVASIQPGQSKTFAAISFGLNNLGNYWQALDNSEVIPTKAVTEELAVGGGAAIGFGATTPGAIATPAAVNRFIKVIASDGVPVYIPAWR
jgi:hypothetical protein